MMLVESLQYALTHSADLVPVLGTPASRPDSTNGAFPTQAPEQPSMPYLVLSQVSGEPTAGETFEGTGALTSERWRFSFYGTTYKNAKRFAKLGRRLLLTLKGAQVANVFIQSAACVMESDEAESLFKGTLYSTHVDVAFVYTDNDI